MKNQQAVKQRGGKVLQPKHPIGPHGYRALILDSKGNRIALYSPRPDLVFRAYLFPNRSDAFNFKYLMDLTAEQERIRSEALAYARANKKSIAKRLTDPKVFVPEDHPVSVFMAGSPGAGKTEASIALLSDLQKGGSEVLRIDPDDLRSEFAGYTGENSWLFQPAVSILVEKIHDLALDQKQSFLLDGTLSHYNVAKRNVDRSLGKGRTVQILYVYQEPLQAWGFVCAREAAEERRIPPEQFIDQYFAARDVVNRLKRELGAKIQVDLLMKNNDGSRRFYRAGVDQIDNHIPEKYDRAALEQVLGLA